MEFQEKFLQFVWQYQLFSKNKLFNTNRQSIEIIHPGYPNNDAGPDFTAAKIKINNIIWAGNVEIHKKSSDWKKHQHHLDEKYNNVILHVVYEHDILESRYDERIENNTLTLKGLINKSTLLNYSELSLKSNKIPCSNKLSAVSDIVKSTFLERILINRLERKSLEIISEVIYNKGDWNQTFYTFLFKTFGFKTNSEVFEILARSIPYKIFERNKLDLFVIESILFGQSGFLLGPVVDEYQVKLQQEYMYQLKKYDLTPINPSMFKFLRTRPKNFPTVRLAQLASILCNINRQVISSIIQNEENIQNFDKYFRVKPSNYWQNHWTFGKKSTQKIVSIGKDSMDKIMINLIIPFKFAYAHHTNNEFLKERALSILMNIKGENNIITKIFEDLNFNVDHAFQSQSIIELHNEWCVKKKCLDCTIGKNILQL